MSDFSDAPKYTSVPVTHPGNLLRYESMKARRPQFVNRREWHRLAVGTRFSSHGKYTYYCRSIKYIWLWFI